MRVVSRLDANGLFAEDVLLEDGQDLPAGCVEERPPEGFHAPRWDGSGWIEAKPEAEILAALKASKRAELEAVFVSGCEADFSSPWSALGALPTDPRLPALKARAVAYREKLAAVEAATTEAEVEGVEWT